MNNCSVNSKLIRKYQNWIIDLQIKSLEQINPLYPDETNRRILERGKRLTDFLRRCINALAHN